jgi:recombination protein RecT
MSTKEAREALERASEPQGRTKIRDLIDRMEPELVRSLQDPGAAQRLARHYLTAIRLTPALLECTTESLLAALLLSAQVGLEPGPLGHVYLVPFGAECTWILGYTGIVELARRSGSVADLSAEVVWDNDVYERPWRNQTGVRYEHRPGDPEGRQERVGVLVTWRELSGGKWFPRAVDVDPGRVQRAQKASRAKSGPWLTDPDAMWRKTGVRAVRPWLPLSPQAGYALAVDGATVTNLEVIEESAEPVLTETVE